MNRILFVFTLLLTIIFGVILIRYEVRGYGFYVLALGSVATILRRKSLDMKPLLGGRLRDIPRYFQKP